jgi:hypothetical protein
VELDVGRALDDDAIEALRHHRQDRETADGRELDRQSFRGRHDPKVLRHFDRGEPADHAPGAPKIRSGLAPFEADVIDFLRGVGRMRLDE